MDLHLFLILGVVGLAIIAADRRGLIDVENVIHDLGGGYFIVAVVLVASAAVGVLLLAARRRARLHADRTP